MIAKSSVLHWIAVAPFKDKETWSKKGSNNWKTQIMKSAMEHCLMIKVSQGNHRLTFIVVLYTHTKSLKVRKKLIKKNKRVSRTGRS